MAKIIYGLPSIGMGHAVRSKTVIQHLEKKHTVLVLTSGTSYNYLKKHVKNIYKVPGLELAVSQNKAQVIGTIWENAKKLNFKNNKQLQQAYKKIKRFNPSIAISDFETFTDYFAKTLTIPIIRLDNQKYLTNGKFHVPIKQIPSYLLARFTIWLITKKADAYVTLVLPEDKIKAQKNVYTIPPILRNEVIKAKPTKKQHVLVYDTTKGHKRLIKELKKVNAKFIVYGHNKTKKEGHIQFKRFSQKQFLTDLASCKAVITTAGFGLTSESIALGKPILAIPIKRHFEQYLNAKYIHRNRYGKMHKHPSHKTITHFLKNLKRYQYKPQRFSNEQAFGILDWIIKEKT